MTRRTPRLLREVGLVNRMTGREKILQAFEPSGTPEIGVVTCYDSIFIRDHWFALTDVPWWYAQSGVVEKELAWAGDVCRKTGLEWFTVSPCPSRVERSRHQYDQREDGVWLANGVTGRRRRLSEPMPSGTNTSCASSIHGDLDSLPATEDEVNALIPLSESFDRGRFLDEGRHDVAVALRDSLDVLIYGHISSPLWSLYSILGYEGMMVFLLQDRGLSSYAAERILQNTVQRIRMFSTLGADAIWIEECLTDQISPEIFVALNVPILRECVKEIRSRQRSRGLPQPCRRCSHHRLLPSSAEKQAEPARGGQEGLHRRHRGHRQACTGTLCCLRESRCDQRPAECRREGASIRNRTAVGRGQGKLRTIRHEHR